MDDSMSSDNSSESGESSKSWSNKDILSKGSNIEMIAMQSQLKSAQSQNESLNRRNQDLE